MVVPRPIAGRCAMMSPVSEGVDTGERTLAAEAVIELIDAGATLIDVRRPFEYEGGHLEDAINIEMNELTARSAEVPRNHPVVFTCRTGNRSGMAADAFREAGWDAHNLEGGLEQWVASGRPLVPEDGEVRPPPPPS